MQIGRFGKKIGKWKNEIDQCPGISPHIHNNLIYDKN